MDDIVSIAKNVTQFYDRGATNEEVIQYLNQVGITDIAAFNLEVENLRKAGGVAPKRYGPAEALVAMTAKGATLGLSDEIGGAAQAVLDKAGGSQRPIGELYGERRAQIDLANRQFEREFPNASAWPATLGSVTAPGGLLTKGGKLIEAAVTPLQRIATGALMGGTTGAAAGWANAEPGKRVQGSYEGAQMGAALGAILPAGMDAMSRLRAPAQRLAGWVERQTGIPVASGVTGWPGAAPAATSAADAKILQAMERDGSTPAGYMAAMESNRQAGAPLTVADIGGQNVRGLARATVTLPGQGRQLADANISGPARVDVAQPRIQGYVEDLAGGPARNTDEALAAARAKLRGESDSAYGRAYAQGELQSAELRDQLEQVTFYRQVYEPMREALNARSKDVYIPPLFDAAGKLSRNPTVRDIDLLKRGIDKHLYAAGKPIISTAEAAESAVLTETQGARRQLMDIVDPLAPGYAAVRKQFGNEFEIQKAMDSGLDAMSMTPRQITAAMNGMSAAAREEFRRSALDAVRLRLLDAADRGRHTDLAKAIFGTGAGTGRARLAALFGGDGKAFARFEQQMRNELTRYESRAFQLGGSQTANKLAETEDLNADLMGAGANAAVTAATSGPASAVAGGMQRLAGPVTNRARSAALEGTRDEIARDLFRPGSDLDAVNAFLQRLEDLRLQRIAAGGRLPFYTGTAGVASGLATE